MCRETRSTLTQIRLTISRAATIGDLLTSVNINAESHFEYFTLLITNDH